MYHQSLLLLVTALTRFLVFDILTIFLWLAILGMIQDHNQGTTKPNQAKLSL